MPQADAQLFELVRALRLLMRARPKAYAVVREGVSLHLETFAEKQPEHADAGAARQLARALEGRAP